MNGIQLAQDTGLWHAFVNTNVQVRSSFESWWALTNFAVICAIIGDNK